MKSVGSVGFRRGQLATSRRCGCRILYMGVSTNYRYDSMHQRRKIGKVVVGGFVVLPVSANIFKQFKGQRSKKKKKQQ